MNGPEITLGIAGDQQESCFMNATLSLHGDLAVSIAVIPTIPEGIETEQDVADYLREELKHLTQIGWLVEIQVGPDQPPLQPAENNDEAFCGQCEGTGTTQSASNGKDEPCPVCDASGVLAERSQP